MFNAARERLNSPEGQAEIVKVRALSKFAETGKFILKAVVLNTCS